MESDVKQVRLYQYMTLAGGVAYLLWWKAVDLLLPSSFNPLGSRLVVVFLCLGVFLASFRVERIRRSMSAWFLACLWAITLHFFYLFRWNETDINWVAGAYIVVIAASACTTTMKELAAYAAFVLFLSALLVSFDPPLRHSIFLSGIVTILAFAYLGLRPRVRLVARSREAAQRLQNLFDAVYEGIALLDGPRVIDANEAFARTFGYTRAEVIGMNVEAFAAPESRQLILESVRTERASAYEAIGLRKDGSTIPLEINGKKHVIDGVPVRLTALRDLSERRRSERTRIAYEAAQESLRVRDEFLLILSHELKTPITNIKLQTVMARRSLPRAGQAADLDRLQRMVDQTDQQANRLVRLIEDMVDLARIGMGEWPTERKPCDLSQIVRTAVASQADALQQAGCDVRLKADGPVLVSGDERRLEQVVVNLLTNAMKYGARRPVIVSTGVQGDEAFLSVKDEGIGISPADQKRVFDRFERAVSARHISGMGLGLFICKFIVEAHGGHIELVSAPGEGSCFSVFLPLMKERT